MRVPLALRRIRPAEALIAVWLAFVGAVSVVAGPPRAVGLAFGLLLFQPLGLILLVTLGAYLVELTLMAGRKAAATVAAAAREASVLPDLSFAGERRVVGSALAFLRDCFPLYVCALLYPATDELVFKLHGLRTADASLIRWDDRLFGGQASVWLERFLSPRLTDVLSLCYFLHVVLVVAVLMALHFAASRRLFVEAMQGVVTMMVVGLALYVLVPAVGPKYTLAAVYTRGLSGGAITDVNAVVMEALRATRDVFPSLHVALSGLLLAYAWRASRVLGLVLVPLVAGNWASTVYLRYHYLVDIVAGAVLIPLVYAAVHRWMEGWWTLNAPAQGERAA